MTRPEAVLGWFQKYVAAPKYKPAQRLSFHAADGVRLHAVRLAGPEGCGATVVLAHGFGNWHRHPKIHQFATQLSQHANVIVLDLRGHGFSEGTSTLGALEFLDVAAAVEQVPEQDALILIGSSMGSAASVIYAGRAAAGLGGRKADAVVAISGPAWWGGRDAARGVGRVLELAASPFMRFSMKHLMRVRIEGMRLDGRIDPVTVVGAIAPTPVVFVHDKVDWYFGVDQAEAMQSAAGPTARLWWREGGHATDLFNEALTAQIVQDVIEPTVVAFRAGEVPVLLEGDRGAVVEVVPEVRVERDAAFVVDGKPAALHIPNAPILGT
jgi:pimeloyl-ACP methyl ester carboxylesterase